jgi:hypothetical protein
MCRGQQRRYTRLTLPSYGSQVREQALLHTVRPVLIPSCRRAIWLICGLGFAGRPIGMLINHMYIGDDDFFNVRVGAQIPASGW